MCLWQDVFFLHRVTAKRSWRFSLYLSFILSLPHGFLPKSESLKKAKLKEFSMSFCQVPLMETVGFKLIFERETLGISNF